jgi:hypothetical protein
MKIRCVSLVLVIASGAAAQTAYTPLPLVPAVEETGQVPLDCDKKLGAYQFAKERYEAKVKITSQTWEDVANYHSTRGDWLECVANGQFEAIKAERHARNELIVQLNAANASANQLNEEIVVAQELFSQCDKSPLPADQALKTCGPQTFIQACAVTTVRRLFAKENARSEGPRGHMLRSILQQSLARRVNLLQCMAERGGALDAAATAESAPQPTASAALGEKSAAKE